MWDAEKDDDASFERRLDSVVREIGDRGKVQVSEAVPPPATPAPAPAPALIPTLAPAPMPAVAPAPAPAPMTTSPARQGSQPSVSPTLALTAAAPPQSQPQPAASVTTSSGFAEMVSFMREEREQAKAERDEMEAKLESMRAEQKAQQQQAEAQNSQQKVRELASAMSCVSEGQLELLQTRLDALHQAKLLNDDEIGALEDCVADYINCRSSLNPAATNIGVAAEKVKKMVGLSEAVGKDGMLARQLRRSFVL